MRDPLPLAQELIRMPSITPEDAGALNVVQRELERMGFVCWRLPFGAVDNLYARLGEGPSFCFAGHTDVVPPGDLGQWTADPFAAEVKNGWLTGRGAADMKGAIAAYLAALDAFLAERRPAKALSLLITGDEEGVATHGTVKVLEWLEAQSERLDCCLVGEPTSAVQLGDMLKIGRRGSLNADILVRGTQGHVGYPERFDNPLTRLVRLLNALKSRTLDEGTEWFQASNLEITTIDAGNATENLVPAEARARLNIRFNVLHSGKALEAWIRQTAAEIAPDHAITVRISGEAFLTEPCGFTSQIEAAIQEELGAAPQRSTTGGTSDARFISRCCPVAEFGLVGATMHKVDEMVEVADLARLARVYRRVLERVAG